MQPAAVPAASATAFNALANLQTRQLRSLWRGAPAARATGSSARAHLQARRPGMQRRDELADAPVSDAAGAAHLQRPRYCARAAIFAQASLSDTVRLNTTRPGTESPSTAK